MMDTYGAFAPSESEVASYKEKLDNSKAEQKNLFLIIFQVTQLQSIILVYHHLKHSALHRNHHGAHWQARPGAGWGPAGETRANQERNVADQCAGAAEGGVFEAWEGNFSVLNQT